MNAKEWIDKKVLELWGWRELSEVKEAMTEAYLKGREDNDVVAHVRQETLEQEIEVLKREIYRLNNSLDVANELYRAQGQLLKQAEEENEALSKQ